VPLDKTSRQFLDRVNAVWGSHIAAPAVKAERARIRARVQELRDNWHAYDEMNDVGVLVDAMYDAFDKLIVMLDEEDIPHEV
jgi:hypothetical protein